MNNPFLTLNLADEAQTLALGTKLGPCFRAGDFIALNGPLGAGKTTLARGLIRAFVGETVEVPSPTFTLVQTYHKSVAGEDLPQLTDSSLDLYHFDLYRLKNAEEVWELGWEDIGDGVALVEWPDKAGAYLPTQRLDIALSFYDGGRIAQFSAHTDTNWKDRLNGA